MEILHSLMLAVHVLTAVAIVVLVLLQQGKGADMGAAFGTGSAGSVFGAAGSANFLSRSTAVAATVFFVTSIALTYYGSRTPSVSGGIMQGVSTPAKQDAAKKDAVAPAAGSEAPKQDVPK
jgi:preprotein translocase subunit SecG